MHNSPKNPSLMVPAKVAGSGGQKNDEEEDVVKMREEGTDVITGKRKPRGQS